MRATEMLVLLIGLGVVVACGTDQRKPPYDAIAPAAAGESYVVTAATSAGQPRPLVPGSQIQISLSANSITLSAGCNTMAGRYELAGSRLVVQGLSSTEIGCTKPLMAQDAWVTGLFAHPVQYVRGKDAAIISGGVVLALAPRPAAEPDSPLSGTTWVLDTLIEGAASSSVPRDVAGSLVIAGGSARISDGCNTGTASVAVTGDLLRFSDVVLTVRPCPSATSPAVGAVRAVLDGTVEFVISGRSLRITHGQQGLEYQAAATG
ncbi:MAG TPA: META domain-containing protein [Marmoricola sp.]|nr:META domain-containing protein [Marmoricola sp.]